MKTILTASLLLLSSFAAVGQTQQPTAADSSETRNNAPERHHNYGWIGLIGLAGLVGLRRPCNALRDLGDALRTQQRV
jgi:MYXO-CTERM domain-containing protein